MSPDGHVCSCCRTSFVINKLTMNLVKPATVLTLNQYYSAFRVEKRQKEVCAQNVGKVLVQDSVGNERRLHRENQATGGGNLAKLYFGLHAAASALELSWLV